MEMEGVKWKREMEDSKWKRRGGKGRKKRTREEGKEVDDSRKESVRDGEEGSGKVNKKQIRKKVESIGIWVRVKGYYKVKERGEWGGGRGGGGRTKV